MEGLLECPQACIDTGYNKFRAILKTAFETIFVGNTLIVESIISTFECSLPKDIINKLKLYINNIVSESSNIVSYVNLLYIITIYVTLLLLIIFVYLTIYLQNDSYTLLFVILSIIVIIIGALILYFGLNYIYNQSSTYITTQRDQLIGLINDIDRAKDRALCYAGNCKPALCINNNCNPPPLTGVCIS